MSINDLYHKLFYHWVHDDFTFADEQQWNQVLTDLLMMVYFECQPVSMFNTRLRFKDNDGVHRSFDHVKVNNSLINSDDDQGLMNTDKDTEMNSDWDEDWATLINSDSDIDDDASTCYDSKSDSNSESNSNTDDDINAGLDETKSLLWRHITFYIAQNSVSEKLNILFVKVTLIHIKKEDNQAQE